MVARVALIAHTHTRLAFTMSAAVTAGIGMAIVAGPLGCFVIWRRLSYFGDTLAHSALLGVTLAFTMEFNIALSVFIISSLIALTLIQLQKRMAGNLWRKVLRVYPQICTRVMKMDLSNMNSIHWVYLEGSH